MSETERHNLPHLTVAVVIEHEGRFLRPAVFLQGNQLKTSPTAQESGSPLRIFVRSSLQ